MPKTPELLEMMKCGVHFGHTTSRWHPKMEQNIFAIRQGIHIIDLEQTQKQFEEALQFVTDTVASGKSVLWIATKKQARDFVKEYASKTNSPYVVDKWLGGTFTNFDAIQGLIKKLEQLEKEREEGKLEKYTKKEQLDFSKEIERLEYLVGGIREMKQLPGLVFMIDIKEDKTPRLEANKRGVPVVAVTDTNVNPSVVDYPISGNDDAVRAIELYCKYVAEAIAEGQKLWEENKKKIGDKPARGQEAKEQKKTTTKKESAPKGVEKK